MSWTTFKNHIEYLLKLGYVVKDESNEYDRRTSYVYNLTPNGKKFLTDYYNFAVNYEIMPQIEGDFIDYKGEQ